MIRLDQANTLIAAAFAEAKTLGFAPLTVAVLDPGGHTIALQRQDGSSNLALGVSSRKIADMAAGRPSFVASLGPISDAGVIPAAGGVIVADSIGQVIGAVGVTGDNSDNDELAALAGIKAAGLVAVV